MDFSKLKTGSGNLAKLKAKLDEQALHQKDPPTKTTTGNQK